MYSLVPRQVIEERVQGCAEEPMFSPKRWHLHRGGNVVCLTRKRFGL